MVKAAQHTVEGGGLVIGLLELLDSGNTLDTHVAGYLRGVGAPRCYHLGARADECSFDRSGFQVLGPGEEPCKLSYSFLREFGIALDGYEEPACLFEECNHVE